MTPGFKGRHGLKEVHGFVPITGHVGQGRGVRPPHPRAHLPSFVTLQRAAMMQLNRSHSSRVE